MLPLVHQLAEVLSVVIELAGVVTIAAGAALATAAFALATVRRHPLRTTYHQFRRGLGRSVLLGLEFLVAADIIRTVTLDLTLESLAALAVLIFLRTVLSLTIEVETEGQWPWDRGHRRELEAAEKAESGGSGA
jgi:uncharacterized membrane protein